MPSVNSDTSDRMPLQASATSSVAFARIRTLPSRRIGNIERADRVFADVRREQLQRKRDLVEDDRRQRNHQQHERQREQQHAQALPAEQEQDGAAERADQRDPRQEQLRAEQARDEHGQAAGDDQQSEHRRPERRRGKRARAAPTRSTPPAAR